MSLILMKYSSCAHAGPERAGAGAGARRAAGPQRGAQRRVKVAARCGAALGAYSGAEELRGERATLSAGPAWLSGGERANSRACRLDGPAALAQS